MKTQVQNSSIQSKSYKPSMLTQSTHVGGPTVCPSNPKGPFYFCQCSATFMTYRFIWRMSQIFTPFLSLMDSEKTPLYISRWVSCLQTLVTWNGLERIIKFGWLGTGQHSSFLRNIIQLQTVHQNQKWCKYLAHPPNEVISHKCCRTLTKIKQHISFIIILMYVGQR